jgi:hypothetical protein
MMRALKTDSETLFAGYRSVLPEDAPMVEIGAKENDLRREIVNVAMSLPLNRLRVLSATAAALRELALAS